MHTTTKMHTRKPIHITFPFTRLENHQNIDHKNRHGPSSSDKVCQSSKYDHNMNKAKTRNEVY